LRGNIHVACNGTKHVYYTLNPRFSFDFDTLPDCAIIRII
jgi:hypothetical protein